MAVPRGLGFWPYVRLDLGGYRCIATRSILGESDGPGLLATPPAVHGRAKTTLPF